MTVELPPVVAALVDRLADADGVVAVVLGGSRALGVHHADSDWDVGLYYRSELDLSGIAELGDLHPPGSWGRIMNGGAWLTVDGTRIDIILRDLDVVDHWAAEAHAGRFEVDGLLGYAAGITTYSLLAEAHVSIPLRGAHGLDTTFPAALAEAGPPNWRFRRDFNLYHAAAHARRGNHAAAFAQSGRALLEEAHARCCERRLWTINEKYLIEAADLGSLDGLFADLPPAELVARLRSELGTANLF